MKLLRALALLLLLASSAWATDKVCGRDTDRDGDVDEWCPSGLFNCTDEDGDGVCASDECNDRDYFDRPDGYSGTDAGCSNGEVKICQPDGMYTACMRYCPLEASRCYYLDSTAGNDTTGDGTWEHPWETAKMFCDTTSPPTGRHTPIPGDFLIYKDDDAFDDTGTLDGYSMGCNFDTGHNGTEEDPIGIGGTPGGFPTFTASGVASFLAIHDGASHYRAFNIIVEDSEFNGYTNNVGLGIDGGEDNKIFNIIGNNNSGYDNTALIGISSSLNSEAHHFFASNQSQAGGNEDNTALFLGYRGTNTSVHDFVLWYDSNPGGYETFKIKHSDWASAWSIYRFYVELGQMQFASRLTTIRNGLLINSTFSFTDPGGTAFAGDEDIENVTVVNDSGPFLICAGYKHWNIDGSPTADNCTSTFTISNISLKNSVFVDSNAAYTGQDDRIMLIGTYDSDPMFVEVNHAIKLETDIIYNPNATPSFGSFERNEPGENDCNVDGVVSNQYGDLGGAYSLAQLSSSLGMTTTDTVILDPQLGDNYEATAIGYEDRGYNGGEWASDSPDPDPSPSTRRKGQNNYSGRKGQ